MDTFFVHGFGTHLIPTIIDDAVIQLKPNVRTVCISYAVSQGLSEQ